MSRALVEKIRKQREVTVKIGKFTFTARRPTDVEAIALHRSDGAYSTIAADYVINWAGVTEDDVIGGGSADPLAWSAVLWAEWCADRPDFWGPISEAVLESYRLHASRMEDATKN